MSESFHYFLDVTHTNTSRCYFFLLFARAFDNTDRKTFIIFRSLFESIVNKSFSASLGLRFSLPAKPLKSSFFADGGADVIAIVELSSSARLSGFYFSNAKLLISGR